MRSAKKEIKDNRSGIYVGVERYIITPWILDSNLLMLTTEEFTAIASAKSEEERQVLCTVHNVSYETFSRLWPIEQFGRDVLAGNMILLKIEHIFPTSPVGFDPEGKSLRVTNSLLVTYLKSSSMNFFSEPEYHESMIEVNWLDVTPSLEKAIHEALANRRE